MDFKSLLKEAKVDAILLFSYLEKNDSNFTYLTGYKNMDSYVLISKKAVLYVSPLEIGGVKNSRLIIKPMTKEMFNEINTELKGKKIGVNYDFITVNELNRLKEKIKDVEFIDVSKVLENKRIVKTNEEIEKITEACNISDKILSEVFAEAHKYKTENELKEFIENLMKEHGVVPSFPTIVASGKNSAIPHHIPDETKLKGFTVLDLGVVYKNYCSDISRTIYFGKPTKEEKESYMKVLTVQKDGIEMIKPGVTFKSLHESAKEKLGKEFMHSLGHGLGIDVHELPYVNTEGALKENSIITIEPGIYFPEKYGIRIEDDVVVREKPIVLNKTTKELITI